MAPINKLLLTFLLNSHWEITLIFAVTQIGLWVMRRSPARFHYRGWIAATVMATFLPMASILGHIQPLSLPFSGAATSHHDWWFRGHNIVSPTSLSLQAGQVGQLSASFTNSTIR